MQPDYPISRFEHQKARAEELAKQSRQKPERFSEVAKEQSQDPGSAANGGDLDYYFFYGPHPKKVLRDYTRHVAVVETDGGALIDDVQRAYDAIMPINPRLAILQCTAGYPAAFDELDLGVIAQYRERFPGAVIGFSSHDNGIAMPVAAYVLGARIVEKHFTLDRNLPGPDHRFSLDPGGLAELVAAVREGERAIGVATIGATASDLPISPVADFASTSTNWTGT